MIIIQYATKNDIDDIMRIYHQRDDKDDVSIAKYDKSDIEFYVKENSSGNILVCELPIN